MTTRDYRGKAGAIALKKDKEEKIKQNIKKLKSELEYYKKNNINFRLKDISDKTEISIATLYRAPYREIIETYKSGTNVINKVEQIELLIFEREQLKREIELLKEENRRLLDEITYSKEFFK